MRLGINTSFAIKRWPEPQVWLDLVQQRLGLDLIQFSTDQLSPYPFTSEVRRCAQRIRRAAEERRITIHSVQVGLAYYTFNGLLDPDPDIRQTYLRWCRDAILLAAELGAPGFGGPLGAMSRSDYDQPQRRSYLTAWLQEAIHLLGEAARAVGLQFLLWEPTPLSRELSSTLAETARLTAAFNEASPIPVRLCLDVGHACHPEATGEDADPYAWIRRLGSEAALIHVQQTDGKGDRHWPFTPAFNEQGIIRVPDVVQAMQEGGCRELPIVFEVFHAFEAPDETVLDELTASVEHWRQALDR